MNGRRPGGFLNKVLTFIAIAIMLLWVRYHFFTAEGRAARAAYRGLSVSTLLSLSIFIVCLGYLFWRFMSYIFWRKYFGDKPPPDEP